MKTPITKQIADRLEELAAQWKDHTSQAEALMMAAKEVMTFQEKEKKQIMKEHTLQDVADDITGVIGSLAYFVESEALDVNGLMDRLEAIRDEIEETLD